MAIRKCTVCDSPNATNYHFGARSCKACAAFFRRSVAMHQSYDCLGDKIIPCKINFALRLNCRHCRLKKCRISGMSEDLVQAKREIKPVPKRRKTSSSEESSSTNEFPTQLPPLSSVAFKEECSTQLDYIPNVPEELQFYPPSDNEWGYSPPEKMMRRSYDDLMGIDELQQFMSFPAEQSNTFMGPLALDPQYYDSLPSTSSSSTQSTSSENFQFLDIRTRLNSISDIVKDDFEPPDYEKAYDLMNLYSDQMFNLNMRRKITYTSALIGTVFDDACICPYKKSDLKRFNHREYRQKSRHDYTMVLDYVNRFPEFDSLSKSEKIVLYRTAIGVDLLVDQAFYSAMIYGDEPVLVTTNGEFMIMDPLPTPAKDKDNGNFESDEDYEKYKILTLMKSQQWLKVVVPINKLKMSISEFALFKALTIWQYNYFKLQEGGKNICDRQRKAIIKSLYFIIADEGHEEPEIRIADIIMAMSHVLEQLHEMITNYIELEVLDVLKDPILKDILKFEY